MGKAIELEVGKSYRTRDGRGPVRITGCSGEDLLGGELSGAFMWWYFNGKYMFHGEAPMDLVAEWEEPGQLRLEAGKWYEDGEGNTQGPMEYTPGICSPFQSLNNGRTFLENGAYSLVGYGPRLSLVKEVPAPQEELCQDEGCPNAETPHICVDKADQPQPPIDWSAPLETDEDPPSPVKRVLCTDLENRIYPIAYTVMWDGMEMMDQAKQTGETSYSWSIRNVAPEPEFLEGWFNRYFYKDAGLHSEYGPYPTKEEADAKAGIEARVGPAVRLCYRNPKWNGSK